MRRKGRKIKTKLTGKPTATWMTCSFFSQIRVIFTMNDNFVSMGRETLSAVVKFITAVEFN